MDCSNTPAPINQESNISFRSDVEFGSRVEQLCEFEVFPKLFPHFTPTSVAADSYWRKHGVDYLLKSDTSVDRVLVEVKADRKDTGNIVAEDYSEDKKGTVKYQWLHFSKSDFIIYFVLEKRLVFLLDVSKLRFMVAEGKFKRKSTWNAWGTTYFYLLPIEQLKTQFRYVTFDEPTWAGFQESYLKAPLSAGGL